MKGTFYTGCFLCVSDIPGKTEGCIYAYVTEMDHANELSVEDQGLLRARSWGI